MATFGGYRSMWLIVFFDLPTTTNEERTQYRLFHHFLLKEGFLRLQYSVYARHCAGEDNGAAHQRRVLAELPSDGEIRILRLTDKQFEQMIVFHGHLRFATERPPEQVLLL